MKEYIAVKENSGIFLSRPEQLEEYAKKGCEIFEVDGNVTRLIVGEKQIQAAAVAFNRSKIGGLGRGRVADQKSETSYSEDRGV